MNTMNCPICKKSPTKHSKEKLIDHLVTCNLFIMYVKSTELLN